MAGLYLQVEVLELDDDALIEAGMVGRGVYLTIGLLAKRTETDGWVTNAQLRKEGATAEQVTALAALGLLDVGDDGRVRQHGWLDRNPSQAAIDQRREAKAEAGKRGNHDRWKHPEPFDSCSKCHVVAPCDPVGVASDPKRSPKTESETKSYSESEASEPTNVSEIQSPPPERVAETLPKLTGKDLDQATARAVLAWSNAKAKATDAFSPGGLARSLRADAQTDGTEATIRAWIADEGMSPDDAATRMLNDDAPAADDPAVLAEIAAAAKRREAETAALLGALSETPDADHAAGIAMAKAARRGGSVVAS
jgi:hypothetical protein